VLADKWKKYEEYCKDLDEKNSHKKGLHKSFEQYKGEILGELGIDKICCKRHFLGHVDLINYI
jgi:DNA-directed RNA polymerase subunit N (RpoN/RPB10)